jgi:RNA polymerase sigma-70 factor (ECF subfamily)
VTDEAPSTRQSLLIRLRDLADEETWSEFMEIYGPLIHRLARRRGLQDADADDLVQEVFRAVARAIERYDPDPTKGSFRGWLSRIARNLIINLLAARRRHPQGTGDPDIQRLLEHQPDRGSEDSALFQAEYRRRLIVWAAERIRNEFSQAGWQAFWQVGVEARSPKDVAKALGMTLGSVYQYKSRAVVRIRHEIEQFGWESAEGF